MEGDKRERERGSLEEEIQLRETRSIEIESERAIEVGAVAPELDLLQTRKSQADLLEVFPQFELLKQVARFGFSRVYKSIESSMQ